MLTIASRREEREYSTRPLSQEVVGLILEAGRVCGSARNEQPCRLTCITPNEASLQDVAKVVTRPSNVMGARLLIAITVIEGASRPSLDAGRVIQNMLLAAWDQRVGACPNTVKEPELLRELLGTDKAEEFVTLLSFGYLSRERDVSSHPPAYWFDRADRKPLEEIVRWVTPRLK